MRAEASWKDLTILWIVPLKGSLYGGVLLLAYGLGQCVIVLVAGVSAAFAKRMVGSRGASRTAVAVRRVAGVVLIALGLYFIFTT